MSKSYDFELKGFAGEAEMDQIVTKLQKQLKDELCSHDDRRHDPGCTANPPMCKKCRTWKLTVSIIPLAEAKSKLPYSKE